MNWAAEYQRMQKWAESQVDPAPHVNIDQIRNEFDSQIFRTDEALAEAFAVMFVFEPAGWVPMDDALLSPEQWRYLSGK